MTGGGLATFGTMIRRPLEWLVPALVPRGELIVSAGRSGTGKSTWLAALAAHCTGGPTLASGDRPTPMTALLYGAETDPEGEGLDRLEAAGADLHRCISGDQLADHSAAPRLYLPEMLGQLADRIKACRAGLVIIDPLASYLSGSVQANDGAAIRAVLLSLQQLCRDSGCTMAVVAHNRKSQGGDASDWISGHKEWWNTPRWILCHAVDPQSPGRYVLAVGKHSRTDHQPTRQYRIEAHPPSARLVLMGESAITTNDLGLPPEDATERSARREACEYLRMALSDGERRMKDLIADALANGVAVRTLRRAAAELGVSHHHVRTQGDIHWIWRKPANWPAE